MSAGPRLVRDPRAGRGTRSYPWASSQVLRCQPSISPSNASLRFSKVPGELSVPRLSRSLDHSLRKRKQQPWKAFAPCPFSDTGHRGSSSSCSHRPHAAIPSGTWAGGPRANHLSPKLGSETVPDRLDASGSGMFLVKGSG